MTTNERIARFSGATEFKLDGDGVLLGYWPEHDEGRGEGWREVPDYSDDEEIREWHAPGGLLEEIELWGDEFVKAFIDKLGNLMGQFSDGPTYIGMLAYLRATPAQLAAALDTAIQEGVE